MGQLIPLEYKRDKAGFQRLFEEQKEKYDKNPSVCQYHLNMILVQSFICKCDDSEAFPKEYMDEVTDYLFTVEQWQIYELILIGNLYLFMDIALLHRMGQEILNVTKDKCAVARMIQSEFALLLYTDKQSEVDELCSQLKEAIESIRELDGNKMTLKVSTSYMFRSDESATDENMYPRVLDRLQQ